MVLLKEFCEKIEVWKKKADNKISWEISQHVELMLCIFSRFITWCLQLFFKISFFFKFICQEYYRVSDSLNPDQAWHFVGPDLGWTVCKSYQQMTQVGRVNKITLTLEFLNLTVTELVCPTKVSSSIFSKFVGEVGDNTLTSLILRFIE